MIKICFFVITPIVDDFTDFNLVICYRLFSIFKFSKNTSSNFPHPHICTSFIRTSTPNLLIFS
ncbi:MAG: hypothetical protein JWQ54_2782 [Mucilaginibacter sp.]|nr:hypothetical protein [Mucilaginibacter sp.]